MNHSSHADTPNERTHLLSISSIKNSPALTALSHTKDHVTKEDIALGQTAAGEILPYSDYSSIDFLHDLVKDAYRKRALYSLPGFGGWLYSRLDALSGWLVVIIAGLITGFVAFLIDISEATISDFKFGYCSTNLFYSRETCCRIDGKELIGAACKTHVLWAETDLIAFLPYMGFALLSAIIASSITMLSLTSAPSATDGSIDSIEQTPPPKKMYMISGAGIPEIKTILSGFVIPSFLSFKVLILKVVGSVFAVASGLPLGKEAPLIHIGACIANLVAHMFPKYAYNGKLLREMLVAGCAAGISAAFGAPIGGVLFAYEELSVYFPRKALYRTFVCSMCAAIVLRNFNPFGTGKLVLFEFHDKSPNYSTRDYLLFLIIGIAGGIWGGTFTRLNAVWAKWFRSIPPIKRFPVLEVAIVTAIVASLQFPNPATRARYDVIIRQMLVSCDTESQIVDSWVCKNEALGLSNTKYIAALALGTLSVLATTTITAGIKLPSGIIMPALAGGALFGRLLGFLLSSSSQSSASFTDIAPSIPAILAAAAFLAGISRMTISLCAIILEITGSGSLPFVIPHMLAILTAKLVADAISRESIYDLTQSALGHPFLAPDEALAEVVRHTASSHSKLPSEQRIERQEESIFDDYLTARVLVPPKRTMDEITVTLTKDGCVEKKVLEEKLKALRRRGLLDAGVALVTDAGVLLGYLPQKEGEIGLELDVEETELVRLIPNTMATILLEQLSEQSAISALDLSRFVNRAPICVCADAPIEFIVAIFTQVGCRYICLTEEGSGLLIGVVIRKRLVSWLDEIKHHSK